MTTRAAAAGIGFAIAAGQLRFFLGIFGWGCVGLWAIFGIWIAFFLLLSRIVMELWPRYGLLWLPVIWFALEYRAVSCITSDFPG